MSTQCFESLVFVFITFFSGSFLLDPWSEFLPFRRFRIYGIGRIRVTLRQVRGVGSCLVEVGSNTVSRKEVSSETLSIIVSEVECSLL